MHFLGPWKMDDQKPNEKSQRSLLLNDLLNDFRELGGKVIACEMTMEIMGVSKEDLNQDLIDEYGAVGTYIKEARESKITLFIIYKFNQSSLNEIG